MDNKELKELFEYLSWNTTEIFERKTKHYLQVLEDNAEENGDAAKKAVATAAGILPFVGDLGGLLDKASEEVTDKLLDKLKLSSKKEASALQKIIYDIKEPSKLDDYKKILVEVCFELFRSFEYQFGHLTCQNGGEKRGMFKLADHIVNVILRHFVVKSGKKPEFAVEELLVAVVNDEKEIKDKIRKIGMKIAQSELKTFNREVVLQFETSRSIETDELLTKTGLLIVQNGARKYFTNSKKSPNIVGYRRLFSYETDNEDFLESYQEDRNRFGPELDTYDFIFDFSCKYQQVEEAWTFIKKQDPKKMEERLKESLDEVCKELVKVQNYVLSREKHLVKQLCAQMEIAQDSNQGIKDIQKSLKGIENQLNRNQMPVKTETPSNSSTAVVLPQSRDLVAVSNPEKPLSAAKMINRTIKAKIAENLNKYE